MKYGIFVEVERKQTFLYHQYFISSYFTNFRIFELLTHQNSQYTDKYEINKELMKKKKENKKLPGKKKKTDIENMSKYSLILLLKINLIKTVKLIKKIIQKTIIL